MTQELRRLKKLYDILKNFRETKEKTGITKFNMSVWGERRKCGTAACALGTAASYPYFRRQGLRLKFDRNGSGHVEFPFIGPPGTYADDYTKAATFFGIKLREATWLFSPTRYSGPGKITPREVAQRVKQLIDIYTTSSN